MEVRHDQITDLPIEQKSIEDPHSLSEQSCLFKGYYILSNTLPCAKQYNTLMSDHLDITCAIFILQPLYCVL